MFFDRARFKKASGGITSILDAFRDMQLNLKDIVRQQTCYSPLIFLAKRVREFQILHEFDLILIYYLLLYRNNKIIVHLSLKTYKNYVKL